MILIYYILPHMNAKTGCHKRSVRGRRLATQSSSNLGSLDAQVSPVGVFRSDVVFRGECRLTPFFIFLIPQLLLRHWKGLSDLTFLYYFLKTLLFLSFSIDIDSHLRYDTSIAWKSSGPHYGGEGSPLDQILCSVLLAGQRFISAQLTFNVMSFGGGSQRSTSFFSVVFGLTPGQ